MKNTLLLLIVLTSFGLNAQSIQEQLLDVQYKIRSIEKEIFYIKDEITERINYNNNARNTQLDKIYKIKRDISIYSQSLPGTQSIIDSLNRILLFLEKEVDSIDLLAMGKNENLEKRYSKLSYYKELEKKLLFRKEQIESYRKNQLVSLICSY
jgi:hypothetical protein